MNASGPADHSPAKSACTNPAPPAGVWTRVHQALMPDYNPAATAYWWVAVLGGVAAALHALFWLAQQPAPVTLLVLAGVAVAMAAGVFPVRVPHSANSFAAGEIFIFLLLLMCGPQAALLAAAGEAAVGSWRTSRRWTSRLASPAMAALAMLAVGSCFQALVLTLQRRGVDHPGLLVVLAMAFSLGYFFVNTLLVTAVAQLKRGEWWKASDLFSVFGWVGIAYAGSATVSVLLHLTYQQSGLGVLMATVPLLGILLVTVHYFFLQQEAAQAREAELAARHVRELEASERRFHSAFTHASIGMALLSFDGQVLQANDALRELLDTDDSVLVGRAFADFVHADEMYALKASLASVRAAGFEGFALELRCRHSAGHDVWAAAHGAHFSEPDASAPCLILQVQDISARRSSEAELHHIAFHDSLTGLPNRRRFMEDLEQAFEQCEKSGQQVAVALFDLDELKPANDCHGHAAGDTLIRTTAQRLGQTALPDGLAARLGGDEFAVLLAGPGAAELARLAQRCLSVINRPVAFSDVVLRSSATAGGATALAARNSTPEQLLQRADTALYAAKRDARGTYREAPAS